MNPPDVFVSVPTRGQVRWQTVKALNDLIALGAQPAEFGTSSMTVCAARNQLRKQFLGTDCQVLLMVDDDVVPSPAVLKMAMRGVDIVAAPVFISNELANLPFCNVYSWSAPDVGWLPWMGQFTVGGQCVRVDAVGFGAVAIHRRVIEALPPFWHEFDQDGLLTKTEDLPYCKLALQYGFQVWADFNVTADHVTTCNLGAIVRQFDAVLERR